uniref:Ig-like domain-containing protein n=1 Tax=Cyprinus carpio TaxID=7962 RepID=A0A8C1I8H0_CYPCA
MKLCCAFTDVLLFCQKRIFGEEVEMKVRPGDNITLYCDRSVTLGSKIVWIRNCSHENQPSLIIDYKKLYLEIFQRFSFIHNPYSKSYDLHITNISVSDLGLYYCAKLENNIRKDAKGIIFSSEVYYYGNQTRLSLKGKKTLLTVIISLTVETELRYEQYEYTHSLQTLAFVF